MKTREKKDIDKKRRLPKKKYFKLIKRINNLTPREQRNKRKYSIKASEKCRERKKQLENVVASQINSEPEAQVAFSHTPFSSQR